MGYGSPIPTVWGWAKFLGFLLVVAFLVGVSARLACAQERPVPLAHEGRPGLWFSLEEGRAAVSALRESQAARYQVRLLEGQLELAEAELVDVRAALQASTEAEALAEVTLAGARVQLGEADQRARTALAERNRVSGERDVWAGVAVGSGVLAILLGVALGLVLGG